MAELKGRERARMKSIFKYTDATGHIAHYRLTDIVRATLEFPTLAAMYGALELLVTELGEDVQELNDRYQEPLDGGYRDIQLVVRHAGHLCELQLSTEVVVWAKKSCGHRDFEVVRELEAGVAAGSMQRCLDALAWGVDHLGDASEGGSSLRATSAVVFVLKKKKKNERG